MTPNEPLRRCPVIGCARPIKGNHVLCLPCFARLTPAARKRVQIHEKKASKLPGDRHVRIGLAVATAEAIQELQHCDSESRAT